MFPPASFHQHVLCFNCIIRLLIESFFSCITLCPSLCPFKVFPASSSRSNSPQTHTTTPFFLPEAHNGPQCSHCSVPIFRSGLLPTSSSIKWRRAERPAVVKHWLTLHCCPARRATPNLSAGDDWLRSKLCRRNVGGCVLMSLVPRVRTTQSTSPVDSWEQRNDPLIPLFIHYLLNCQSIYINLPFSFISWVTFDGL